MCFSSIIHLLLTQPQIYPNYQTDNQRLNIILQKNVNNNILNTQVKVKTFWILVLTTCNYSDGEKSEEDHWESCIVIEKQHLA